VQPPIVPLVDPIPEPLVDPLPIVQPPVPLVNPIPEPLVDPRPIVQPAVPLVKPFPDPLEWTPPIVADLPVPLANPNDEPLVDPRSMPIVDPPEPLVNPIPQPLVEPRPEPIVDPVPQSLPDRVVNPMPAGGGDICAGKKPFDNCVFKPSARSSESPTSGMCLPNMELAILTCVADEVRDTATDKMLLRFYACEEKKPEEACIVSEGKGVCKNKVSHYNPPEEAKTSRALSVMMCEIGEPSTDVMEKPPSQPTGELVPESSVDPILGGDDGVLCVGKRPFMQCVLKPSSKISQLPLFGLCVPDMEEAILRCISNDVRDVSTQSKKMRFHACNGDQPNDRCSVGGTTGTCQLETAQFRPQKSVDFNEVRTLAVLMCEFPQPIIDPVPQPTPAVNPMPSIGKPRVTLVGEPMPVVDPQPQPAGKGKGKGK